jgi:hypothetical protein
MGLLLSYFRDASLKWEYFGHLESMKLNFLLMLSQWFLLTQEANSAEFMPQSGPGNSNHGQEMMPSALNNA